MDIINQLVYELQTLETRDPEAIQDVLQKFNRSLDDLRIQREFDQLPSFIASDI